MHNITKYGCNQVASGRKTGERNRRAVWLVFWGTCISPKEILKHATAKH